MERGRKLPNTCTDERDPLTDALTLSRTTMSDAESHPEHRKVIQYVDFADGRDADGHGTHVAGIAAGKVKPQGEI